MRARHLAVVVIVVSGFVFYGVNPWFGDEASPPQQDAEEPSRETRVEDGDRPALELMHVITSEHAGPETRFEGFDAFSLNVADVNGDGNVEVVTFNDNARAYVIDPLEGRVLAEIETEHPDGDADAWHRQTLNGIAIGDVTGNGRVELVMLNTAARLEVHEFDPGNSTEDAFAFNVLWRHLISMPSWDSAFFDNNPWWSESEYEFGAHGHAFIADVGESGGPWVFVQSDDWPGQFAFNADGELRWKLGQWDGHSGPWVGDLTGDDDFEAVFPMDNGRLSVFDATSGQHHWTFKARDHGASPGSIPVMPLVADFDGDGENSLFVGARVAVKDGDDPNWMERQNAMYFMLDEDGSVEWWTQPSWGNPLYHMLPVPYDVTGDGVLDVTVLDWNTIGHHPGEWDYLGPANLFVLDGSTGDTVWRTEVDMEFSRANVAVADFLNDHEGPEVLVGDRRDGVDGLGLVSLLNGEKREWVEVPDGWTITRGPALADVTGDGFMEAVVPLARPSDDCALPTGSDVEREDVGCREGAIAVYRTGAPEEAAVWSNNLLYNKELDEELHAFGTDVPSVEEALASREEEEGE